MLEKKYFRRLKEIRDREAFDPECEITVENFDRLIGEVHLTEDEPEAQCQVRQLDGKKRCDEGHKNGWLGRRKEDGKEGLIGKDCGIKYFNAHDVFRADRLRIRSELNIEGYLDRLRATCGNSSYGDDLTRTIGRLKFVRETVKDLSESLPGSIVTRLREMAKLKDASFGVRFRYEDEDENGNLVPDWVPVTIGTVMGISVWDQSQMAALFQALYEVRDAHREARAEKDAGERKLRGWADKLDELTVHRSKVADLESSLDAFVEPVNLRNLCFLVPNQNDSVVAARIACEREAVGTVTMEMARKLYRQLCAEVERRGGGRPFKIDW